MRSLQLYCRRGVHPSVLGFWVSTEHMNLKLYLNVLGPMNAAPLRDYILNWSWVYCYAFHRSTGHPNMKIKGFPWTSHSCCNHPMQNSEMGSRFKIRSCSRSRMSSCAQTWHLYEAQPMLPKDHFIFMLLAFVVRTFVPRITGI